MRRSLLTGICLLFATLLPAGGCTLNPFDTGSGDRWEFPQGNSNTNTNSNNDCLPTEEVCDASDNDCNGVVDDVDASLLADDVANCGSCFNYCSFDNAFAECLGGQCAMAGCFPGYSDINQDDFDGCEYPCQETNGGTEICDGLDNNCDGTVDEGTDFQNDPDSCGSCGHRCVDHTGANQSTTGCVGGACQYHCLTDTIDLDGDGAFGDLGSGCEYACAPTNGGTEICDGLDNDCDGIFDEDPSGLRLAEPCYTGPNGTLDVGVCRSGSATCDASAGSYGPCIGDVTPASGETCDGTDNDCNGQIDEGINLDTDINNCGGCNVSCWSNLPPNAYPLSCTAGQCVYGCSYGFNDLNNDVGDATGNGCEYACPELPPGTEVCDGTDNDCDGGIDNGLTPPPGLCNQGSDNPNPSAPPAGTPENNPCKGTTAACIDPPGPLGHGWYCDYDPVVAVDPNNPNSLLGYESLCDDADNDCDGFADEIWLLKGDPCSDDGIGACQSRGHYVCDASGADVECLITHPGASPAAQDDLCNGIDDDCDGQLDEEAPGDMVRVTIGASDFWIDVYEASRADATGLGQGNLSHISCSEPAVMPWTNVSWSEAAAACAAAGKRLCTEGEWQLACEGPLGLVYPYGNSYAFETCNGNDYNPDCAFPDVDAVAATGEPHGCPAPASTQCISPTNVVDQSGNVMEWTASQVSAAPLSYRVRGGSYFSHADAMTCAFDFISSPVTFRYNDLGFRCCSDTFPP